MTPEERLAHLLDDDRWNGPGFVRRPAHPTSTRSTRAVLFAVAAGLVVGAVLTVGIASLRGMSHGSPIAAPVSTASDGVETATPAPISTPPEYTQSDGVDPSVGTALQRAAAKNGSPIAFWGSGRATLAVVVWGAMCDPRIPGPIDASDPRALKVSFSRDSAHAPAGGTCLGGVSVTTTYFRTPADVPAIGAVTIEVTGAASDAPRVVTVLEPDQLADPAAPDCVTSQLSARVSESGGAMGTLYQDLVLTNTSPHACSLEGFPTVDFERNGVVVGSTATNDHWVQKASLVHLTANGGFAAVRLDLVNAANFDPGDCAAVTSSGIRVSISGSSGSLFALWHAQVCTVAGTHQFSASDFLAKRSVKAEGWQE